MAWEGCLSVLDVEKMKDGLNFLSRKGRCSGSMGSGRGDQTQRISIWTSGNGQVSWLFSFSEYSRTK